MRQSTESQIETNQNNDDSPIAFVSMLVLIFVLLISEVRPITALITVAIVCTQTFVGLTVSGHRHDKKKCINAGDLVLGFFYGVVIHVVMDQVLRIVGYRSLALPLLTVISVALRFRELVDFSRMPVFRNIVSIASERIDMLFVSLTLVLIPLCQVWSWSRNSVIVLMVAYLFYSTSFRWVKHKILFVPTLLMVVVASRMRPSYWWLPGWGIDENSIYARAIYNWGPKGDVLLAGVPLKYQWFGYSWMGLMSHVTSANDFEFVSRTSYVICVVAAVLAIYAITYELTQDQRKSVITTFIVTLFSTAISYPVNYTVLSINYQPFAVVSMLCWILMLIKWMKNPTNWNSIALSIAGIICISAKSVHLVPIVGLTLMIALFEFLKKDKRLLLGGVLTVGMSFLYTRAYFPSQKGTGLELKFADFTRQFGVAPEVSSINSRILMVVMVIGALSTLSLILISMNTTSKILRSLRIPLLVYFIVAALMAVTLQRVSSTEMHFLQLFVLISLVLFASSLTECIEVLVTRRFLHLSIAVGVIIALLLMYFSKRLIVNDENYVVLLIKANCALAVFLIFFKVIGTITVVRFRNSRNQLQTILAGLLSMACCTNFIFIASTRDIRPINKVAATYQLGQKPLQEVANWVNQNTNVNTIVASNLFFGEGGTDYCDVPESYLMDSISNQASVTNYYTPIALIQRRFLAAGVQYATISYEESVIPRIQTSLRPACFPDEKSRESLKRFGVEIYIAYRTNQQTAKFWSQIGTVVYQNGLYAVIQID